MDNAALLRIKFRPLLSKVSSLNIDSRCCVEIVPELSGIQNLDKINWKSDKELVEYKIPMTYKITIKKQSPEYQNKVYHSCVDLLPTYSTSHHDFDLASGDVKRVKSDNLLVLNLHSCYEKYDLVPTKNLLTPGEKPNEINTNKFNTVSAQTLEIKANSNRQSPGVDKSFEVNTNIKSEIRVVRSEETLKGDIDKYDIETNTAPSNENDIKLVKTNSTVSLDNLIKKINENHSLRKLSLSPICSVNTWDELPPGLTYISKNNTSSYLFNNSASISKGVTCNMECPLGAVANKPNTVNEPVQCNESSCITPIYETRTYVTLQLDTMDRTENKNLDKKSTKDTPNSMSHVTKTNSGTGNNFPYEYNINKSYDSRNNNNKSYESKNNIQIGNVCKSVEFSTNAGTENNLSHAYNNNSYESRIITKIGNICKSMELSNNSETRNILSHGYNNNTYNPRDNIKIANVCKTIEISNNRKHTSYINKKQSNKIYSPKKGSTLKSENTNPIIFKIDGFQSSGRATPAARVASLVKNIEAEIYPLKKRLHDIKCKCVVLGLDLFYGEFTPCNHKSLIYQPVPNFEYLVEQSSEQQNDNGKSNRVVYSVLFNE